MVHSLIMLHHKHHMLMANIWTSEQDRATDEDLSSQLALQLQQCWPSRLKVQQSMQCTHLSASCSACDADTPQLWCLHQRWPGWPVASPCQHRWEGPRWSAATPAPASACPWPTPLPPADSAQPVVTASKDCVTIIKMKHIYHHRLQHQRCTCSQSSTEPPAYRLPL